METTKQSLKTSVAWGLCFLIRQRRAPRVNFKYNLSLLVNHFLIISFVLLLLCCSSCATKAPSALPPDATADKRQTQRIILGDLTDEILLALARRDYQHLMPLLETHNQKHKHKLKLSGPQIAVLLLGRRYFALTLDRWDAQQIDVQFDKDPSWADTHLDVSFRTAPNRKARTANLTFRFHRQKNGTWRLYLSQPDNP